jgi:hypothetical protein
VISRKTNRRDMTGDHHGRTAKRATLPVTATDEILGTHRNYGSESPPLVRINPYFHRTDGGFPAA